MAPIVVPYVSGEELLGGRATDADVRDLAAALPVIPCLVTLSRLIWHWQDMPAASDQAFARFLGRGPRRIWLRQLRPRPLVFPTRIASAMRVLLLHGDHDRPVSSDQVESDLRQLAHLVMFTADVDNPAQDFKSRDDAQRFIHSFLLLQHDITRPTLMPACAVGRAHRLFVELPPLMDEQHEVPKANIARDLSRACGMPLERYLAITGAVALKFQRERDAADWFIDAGFFANTRIPTEEIDRALDDISASPAELAQVLREQPSDLPDRARGDLNVFNAYPLCRIGDGRFLPLYPPGLLERLSGHGVYMRARAAAENVRDFQAGVGRLFEKYAQELVLAGYRGRSGSAFDEFEYRKGSQSPDIAVRDATNEIVLIEAATTATTLDQMILRGDLDALEGLIQGMVTRRARQLHRKIAALRDGVLTYPGVASTARVWPVLVLMQGLPLGPMTSEMVFRAAAEAGLAPGPTLAPISVLGIEDLELAVARLEQRGVALSRSLAEWHATTGSLDSTLGDFLVTREGHLSPPKVPSQAFEQAAKNWVSQLGLSAPEGAIW